MVIKEKKGVRMKAFYLLSDGKGAPPLLLNVQTFQENPIDWDDVKRQAKEKFGDGVLFVPEFILHQEGMVSRESARRGGTVTIRHPDERTDK